MCAENAIKRKHPRFQYRAQMQYSFDNKNWYIGLTENISEGGVFVQGQALAKSGAKVYFTLKSFKDDEIRLVGKVIWTRMRDYEDTPGMGISILTAFFEGNELLTELFGESWKKFDLKFTWN